MKRLMISLLAALLLFGGCNAAQTDPPTTMEAPTATEAPIITEALTTIKAAAQATGYQKSIPGLLAKLPEEELYLYGILPRGALLYYQGRGTYLDWDHYSPREFYPKMAIGNYDSDATQEIAIALYNKSGTGLSGEELHILEIRPRYSEYPSSSNEPEENAYKDSFPKDEDYEAQLQALISASFDSAAKTLKLKVEGKAYEVDCSADFQDDWVFHGVEGYTNILSYELSDSEIWVEFGAGYFAKGSAIQNFFGTIRAKVNYQEDEGFRLSDLSFVPDKES